MRRKLTIILISWNLEWKFNFINKRTMFRPMSYYTFIKVRQLQVLKAQREKRRDIRNLQERILLDTLEDTHVQLGYGPSQRSVSRLPLSKDKDVKRLQLEVLHRTDREREKKRGREREFYNEFFGFMLLCCNI